MLQRSSVDLVRSFDWGLSRDEDGDRRAVIACSFTLRDVTMMVDEKMSDPGQREALTEKIFGESVRACSKPIDRLSGGPWSRPRSARQGAQRDRRAAYRDAPRQNLVSAFATTKCHGLGRAGLPASLSSKRHLLNG